MKRPNHVSRYFSWIITLCFTCQSPLTAWAAIQSSKVTASQETTSHATPEKAASAEPTNAKSVESPSGVSSTSSTTVGPIASSIAQPASGARQRSLFAYEAYETDLFTGAATLSLPLDVPPGRRGMQPNLVLGYASGTGNDWVGVGWNLTLGAIQRETTKGIPSYTSTDTFVLSWNGINDQLVAIGGGEYRTEVEGSFLRVQFDGVYWKVTDTAGTTYRFGFTSDAQQTMAGGRGTFRWALDRVEDVQGNYLTVSYTSDQGQLYPSTIQYTGSTATSELPRMRVDFTLEDRSDPIVSYRAGGLVETRKRLKQIDASVDGQLAKRYILSYTESPDSFHSLLSAVTIVGSDGVSTLPPSRFTYATNPGTWTRNDAWNIPDGEFVSGGRDQGRRLVDMNGDGLTDLLIAKSSGSSWYVTAYKNTGTGWVKDQNWAISDGNFIFNDLDDGRWFAELNGDGFIDLLIGNSWYGGFYTSAIVNKGTGWQRDVHTWDIPDGFLIEQGLDAGRRLVDLNGDGLSDLLYAKGSSRACYRNTGSGWVLDNGWIAPYSHVDNGADTGMRYVDLNGDGLTDITFAREGVKQSYLNTGSGFTRDDRWVIPDGDFVTNDAKDQGRRLVDVNGDGLPDLLVAKDGYHATYLNTGSGWRKSDKWLLPDGDFVAGDLDQGRWATDMNGDGLADLPIAKDGTKTTYLNTFPPSDLLTTFDNGVGGTTTLTYAASTKYYNSGSAGVPNLPFPVMTVASVTRDDGLGHQVTTTHDYADGKYDWPTREFRGFNRARVLDADGNYTDTWFKQDNIFKGKPYQVDVRAANGNLFGQTDNTWQSTQPYTGVSFAYLASTDQYTCTGDGTTTSGCKLTQTDVTYDSYGNVTKTRFWGETDPNNRNANSGDEVEVQTTYVYNTTAWIVDKPSTTLTIDANAVTRAQAWFYYDGHTSLTDAPTTGLLTKDERWLNTNDLATYYAATPGLSTNPTTRYTYDVYGNVLTVTNANNQKTTTTYETTYYIYPDTVTNALQHQSRATYDARFGVVLTATDPNSVTATTQYDVFGRVVKVIGPNDTADLPTVSYDYDLSRVPIKTVAHARLQSGKTEELISDTFTDGVGRTVQTRAPAEDPTKQIVAGAVELNARGLVTKQWAPYLSNTSSSYVPFSQEPGASSVPAVSSTYDALGRATRLTNPDGSYATTTYDRWTTTTIDTNGHQLISTADAYGRLAKVEEYTGADGRSASYPASPFTLYAMTTYAYDALGNVTTVTDTKSHVTTLSYNSLSRKLNMIDPDMGTWTYRYDLLGNLTTQTDAKAQAITFTYDALSRLLTKTYSTGQPTVTYTYDDPAKPFSKGKLTGIADGSGSSSFTHDNVGRLITEAKTVDGTIYTIQRSYDLLGRLVTLTYPDSSVATYTYNAQGGIETITLQSPVSGLTSVVSNMDYNAAGQLTTITYGNGVTTTHTYDPSTFRLASLLTTHPSAGTLQDFAYTFDAGGDVLSITDHAHTATQTFGYDALSRLTSASGTYGNVTYAYDEIGNLTSKEGVTQTYDLTKPHAIHTRSDGWTFAYDANGNLTSRTSPTQSTTTNTYDAENRLTQVTTPPAAAQTVTLALTAGWNFFSLPVKPADLSVAGVFGSSLASVQQVSRINYGTGTWEHDVKNSAFNQFDTLEVGRGYAVYLTAPVSLTLTGTPPSGTLSLSTGKPLLGNPTAQPLTVAQLLNNLTLGTDVTTVWRYTPSGFVTLANGDPVAIGEALFAQLPASKTWTLPTGATTTSFGYDGDGGRVKLTTSSGMTKFLGASYEIGPDGTTTKSVFAGSQRIATNDSTGALRFYHTDHLGSSNVITNATGALVELAEYTPYGSLSRREGSTNVPQKYTGKRLDPTGLYFYEARYYDPLIGRFLTPDWLIPSFSDPQDLNRYTYAKNNPLKYNDPTGHKRRHFWKWVFRAVSLALIAAFPPTSLLSLMAATFQMASVVTSFIPRRGAQWTSFGLGMAGLGLNLTEGLMNAGNQPGSWSNAAGKVSGPPTEDNWFVTGILTSDDAAQALAKTPVPEGLAISGTNVSRAVFQSGTQGPLVDIAETEFLRALGGGRAAGMLATDMAKAVSQGRVISYIGHSEGAVFLKNAFNDFAKMGFRLPAGSKAFFLGSAVSEGAAKSSFLRAGGGLANFLYKANPGDLVPALTNFNPVQTVYASGVTMLKGFQEHSVQSYERAASR